MAIYYPAVIETDDVGGYGVFFPDLPGCVSAGDTEIDAVENAAEALGLYLQAMLDDRQLPPPPSALRDVPHDPEVQEVGRQLIKVPMKLERINVSFDGALLLAIDQAAEHRGQTRSAFLKDAALMALKPRTVAQ